MYFKSSGKSHRVDSAGNHFIGTKCVNPKKGSGAEIGSTVPDFSEKDSFTIGESVKKTGKVDSFIYFDRDVRKTIHVDVINRTSKEI